MDHRPNSGETSTVIEVDVWESCDRLSKANPYFSCKVVRNDLGRGSMTTIHRYVKSWREAHSVPPEITGTPSDQFLTAFKTELKRNSTAREDQLRTQLAATTEDNEYLYRMLAETETKLSDAAINLQFQLTVVESQKLQIINIQALNEELKIALSDLQDKQFKVHENLGRLEVRLERIPSLERQNEDLRNNLEKERTANTALVEDLAASRAKLGHVEDAPLGFTCPTRNSVGSNVETQKTINGKRIVGETRKFTDPNKVSITHETSPPKDKVQSDEVIAASVRAISDCGPMDTKNIHKHILTSGTFRPQDLSVKSLSAYLRKSTFLTFDPTIGTWEQSPSKSEFQEHISEDK